MNDPSFFKMELTNFSKNVFKFFDWALFLKALTNLGNVIYFLFGPAISVKIEIRLQFNNRKLYLW